MLWRMKLLKNGGGYLMARIRLQTRDIFDFRPAIQVIKVRKVTESTGSNMRSVSESREGGGET